MLTANRQAIILTTTSTTATSRSQQTISAEGAQRVVAAVVEAATRESCPSVVAVVDASGTLSAMLRMDGAPLIGATLAQRKAFTVIALGGADTSKVFDRLSSDLSRSAALSSVPEMTILPGAVPLVVDGAVIGAVGVSSTNGPLEHTLAQAAASALAG